MKKNIVTTVFAVVFFCLKVQALDPPGISEFRSAEREMHGLFFPMYDLVLTLGAITGLIGGVRIYAKWNSGSAHHIDAEIMGWFFACLFLVITGGFLKALYSI